MITTEIKYNNNFISNIKLKKNFNIIFFSFSVILITFAAVFMALAMKEKGSLSFFNLFFSVISITLQVLFMIITGYDYYYLTKIENKINKNGSYSIKLSKPRSIVNKKYSISTIILFVMSILVFLIILTQLTIMLVNKDFYNSFATLLLNFNNLTYILFCFISCAYSDQLHYFNTIEFKTNNEIQTGIAEDLNEISTDYNAVNTNVHTSSLISTPANLNTAIRKSATTKTNNSKAKTNKTELSQNKKTSQQQNKPKVEKGKTKTPNKNSKTKKL